MRNIHNHLLDKSKFYSKWHADPMHGLYHFAVFLIAAIFATTAILSAMNDVSAASATASLSQPPLVAVKVEAKRETKPIADNYIVVLKKGEMADAVLSAHGLKAKHKFQHAINGFSGEIPQGRLDALRKDKRVASVEQDVSVYALGQVVPPGIKRIGAYTSPLTHIDSIDNVADRVNADVAVIDTGVDYTHPDLNVVQHVSFTADSADGMDGHGHGTHVSGIIGALDNGIGVVGVAPGARIWGVKVLDNTGSGSVADIIAGVDYVTAHADQIEVANMSLGGQALMTSLRTAIANSVAKGVVYVVAAGNSDFDIYGGDNILGTYDDFFPASYPEVMTVSALADTDGQSGGIGQATTYGADDTLATFSNFSMEVDASNPVYSMGAAIDIAAPGVNIYSTYKGGAYATMSGTSMASPHAAGLVADYIAKNGRAYDTAGVNRVRQAIIDQSEPQTSWGINPTNPNKWDYNPEGMGSVKNIENVNATYAKLIVASPLANMTTLTTTPIPFQGSAIDPMDGDISSKINWSSSIDGYLGSGAAFSKYLSAGTHNISAQVRNSAGNYSTVWVGPVSITYAQQTSATNPLIISILTPANNATVQQNVKLSAYASSYTDGDVSANIAWTSTLSGSLGTGASITPRLNVGTQTITASIKDSAGNTKSTSVNITAASNNPPSVSISSPKSGATVVSPVTLAGFATDQQDGDISNKIKWESNLDGALGTGAQIIANLRSGTHTIKATAFDSGGAGGMASISLTVGSTTQSNTLPVVTITYPTAPTTYALGAIMTFKATATDAEDGDLSNKIQWYSSAYKGQANTVIGTGATFSTSSSNFSLNVWNDMYAYVYDSAGAKSPVATQSFYVGSASPTPTTTVTPTPDPGTPTPTPTTPSPSQDTVPPTVSVTQPAAGSMVNGTVTVSANATDNIGVAGVTFRLDGTALAPEDTSYPYTFSWNTASYSSGNHTLVATARDTSSNTAISSPVSVTINRAPTVVISSPANNSSYVPSSVITFSGTANDQEDGDKTSSIVWSSNIDGQIGTGGSIQKALSSGTHTISASVTDSAGQTTKSAIFVNVLPQISATVVTNKSTYSNKESVGITVTANSGSAPISGANVSIAITSPKGSSVNLSGTTGADGVLSTGYNINTNAGGQGNYSVRATIAKSGFQSTTVQTIFGGVR